jgi:hypothetical protein
VNAGATNCERNTEDENGNPCCAVTFVEFDDYWRRLMNNVRKKVTEKEFAVTSTPGQSAVTALEWSYLNEWSAMIFYVSPSGNCHF